MTNKKLKKIIKSKIKLNKELTNEEIARESLKYEIAEELGLKDKLEELGWGGLSASETGRIGGLMTKRKQELNIPSNDIIVELDKQNNR